MGRLPRSTIEQWGVLRAVVDEGGFAQAAALLNRSQSSVSYAVARLQEALGLELLEPRGRRAVLTEAGAVLLAEAGPLIEEMARLEARARVLAAGEAAQIRLLVDSLFPQPLLFRALQRFALLHPQTELRLREAVRAVPGTKDEEGCDLAVLVAEPGLAGLRPLAGVDLVAVAQADHPLARSLAPLGPSALARHNRVEIRGVERDDGAPGPEGRNWRMNTVEAAVEAVRRGLCYGWLPRHLIEADLASGMLVPLPMPAGNPRHIPLALWADPALLRASPAVRSLAALLAGDAAA